ncbi:heterokaryon incompatibility protein-domain-containing protein [Dendryphion nanum]|uniref:Heterokaryon incompatibility protein-domain-containing protein n=1 Tax=Dendryphion nanum TaxID=256645 RepID=A0A9P9DUD6_9PLEO|nr:heterokaryon incompatibility protein-domain-containing protein [Dendryphion nanum]
MRLLKIEANGDLSFTDDLTDQIPRYAILSHTWGPDNEEVTFDDFNGGQYQSKAGYTKIKFCRDRAQIDCIDYFWVDSCCINKANYTELSEAINSMFSWYRNAAKCYVFLPNVLARKRGHDQAEPNWKPSFRNSRWFTRGWTLQELLAPTSVEFFSREGELLGDRLTLELEIHETTEISIAALRGAPLSDFSTEERMSWAAKRNTKKKEDKAYCLLGIFNVFIPLIYGEGENAFIRLKEAVNQSSSGASSSQKEQILESLNHGSPFTRVNNISHRSEGTFEWIFDTESSEVHRPEVKLREWFHQGEGVFWIKGKPGSGKSTFMKFLAGLHNHNERTLRLLAARAAPKYPRIISFYFWLSDAANRQNSFHGLLCSLLHQLLSTQSAVFVASLLTTDVLRTKRNAANWDLQELETTMINVACQVATETPLCIFIDGLDECVPKDINRVVNLISELVHKSGSDIKFCISSRPEQQIESRLQSLDPQSLELHQLTSSDIRQHVAGEVNKCRHGPEFPNIDWKDQLIEEIVEKSEGVFLWAMLVTKTLCESIEFGDSIGDLHKQLEELPTDMVKLYHTMLERSTAMKGNRKAEAASYFKFVLDFSHYSLDLVSMIQHENQLARFVPLYEHYNAKIGSEDRSAVINIIKRRIELLCVGIVVVSLNEYDDTTVDFFHRTARDFFYEPSARRILDHCDLKEIKRYCLFVDGVVYQHKPCCGAMLSILSLSADSTDEVVELAADLKESSVAQQAKFLKFLDDKLFFVERKKREVAQFHGNEIDFMILTLRAGMTGLLSLYIEAGREFSQSYKDNLLLRLYGYKIPLDWKKKIIHLGGNPNAVFYEGLQRSIKTSPWLKYLCHSKDRVSEDENGEEEECVQAFLDRKASLEDRTIVFAQVETKYNRFRLGYPIMLWNVYPREHVSLIIEVNAYSLLKEYQSMRKETMPQKTHVFSHTDIHELQAHRRVLLLSPKGNGPFVEVEAEDSKRLLEGLKCISGMTGQNLSKEVVEEKISLAQNIWGRSRKVDDAEQFLEDRGYYSKRGDPAFDKDWTRLYDYGEEEEEGRVWWGEEGGIQVEDEI